MTEPWPEQYVEGVRLFNAREFFACHDVLEELWNETLGEQRQFYQGLIHAAVSLFHFGEGNLGGARKMYGSARRYLEPYGECYMGLNLARFLRDYRECFAELLAVREGYPEHIKLDEEGIPEMELEVSA